MSTLHDKTRHIDLAPLRIRASQLFARLGSALRRLADLRHRRAVLEELGRMTDHELKDIGLTRGELTQVFDPEFRAGELQ
jgi:uncharacterized protein YjiS (DUF1127 family)